MNLLTTCGVILVTLGQIDGPSPTQPIVDIESAVHQLGSTKYQTRQKATEWLWAAGESAVPALQHATKNKNREVRTRAEFILENVQQGIAFNAPRDVLREVQRFRQGDPNQRRAALVYLENVNRPRVVFGLIQSEQDARLRQEWSQNLERALQSAVLAGASQEVEITLRAAASDEEWTRHWVSYLSEQGRLQEELDRVERDSGGDSAERARRMTYLLRAQGKLAQARQFAQLLLRPSDPSQAEAQSPDLAWELVLEQRDWAAAAKYTKDRINQDPATYSKDPESLGFAAAYHRLSGDSAAFAQYTAMLQQVADDAAKSLTELDPRRQDVEKNLIDQQWYVGKALLLNGRLDDAIRILRRHHSAFAFELLCHQQRFREAFEIAGVRYPDGFETSWFEKVAAETAAPDEVSRQKFGVALQAVRQLYFLGKRDDARQWLGVLQRGTSGDAGTIRRRMVIETAVKLAMRDIALEAGAVVLEREGNSQVLSTLYASHESAATVWWEYLREHQRTDSLIQTLKRIDACLSSKDSDVESAEFEQLAADLESRISLLSEQKRADWWHGLAETCLLRGRRENALRFFEKAATVSVNDALRLGDLYAKDGKWTEAADWYEKASKFDRYKALPLWLYADSIRRIGREEEANRLTEVARLLPMGNDEARRELAAGLKERGHREESLRQFELLARTGVPGEQDVIEAAKQIGNAIYPQNELRGADCWETMVLCCLRNKWGFGDANGYVQIPFLVHKTRAKGLLKSGRVEEGLAELWASHAVSPVNLELPEEMLPELQKINHQSAADQLFDRYFTAMKQQSEDFPNCATFHNNLAWLCARTGRELDAAHFHAEEALRIEPSNAAYIDTLGEVFFHRGRLDEAIACADRCLKLEPRSQHYREQMARFSAAKAGGN